MKKRLLLLFPALLLFLLANLNAGYAVSINGERLPGLYSARALFRATAAARALCEELSEDKALLPEIEKRLVFSLYPPRGSEKELSHHIITASGSVSPAFLVSMDGRKLGYVEWSGALKERLHRYACTGMPEAAGRCLRGKELETRRLYCSREDIKDYDWMISFIFESAPEIF